MIHVHLKDVDAAVAGRVAAGDLGYHAGVRAGLYRPLGEGDLDVAGCFAPSRSPRTWFGTYSNMTRCSITSPSQGRDRS